MIGAPPKGCAVCQRAARNRSTWANYAILAIVCQTLAVSAEDYYVQNWRREDGLPDGQVTAIEQTPDGYLWIGTAKGLARFDGVRFKTFKAGDTPTFSDSRVSTLIKDQQGSLWVGMINGTIARRIEGAFNALHPPAPLMLGPTQSRISDTWLWDRRTRMIEEAEGTPRTSLEPPPERHAQLVRDSEGAIWWNVSGLALMRFMEGKWSLYGATNSLSAQGIRQVVCDREGRAWSEVDGQLRCLKGVQSDGAASTPAALGGQWSVLAAASEGGFWVASPRGTTLPGSARMRRLADGRWYDDLAPLPQGPKGPGSVITCLLEDHAGRIWYGTASGGVFFSNSDGEWQRLGPRNSFSQGYISCLFEDQQRNIWIGTVGDGLYRVTPRLATMVTLPPPHENAEVNTCFATRDGSVWMGTSGSGAIRYDGTNFTAFGAKEGLSNPHVCAIIEDSKSNLWVGTSGGLFRWQTARFVQVEGPAELAIWVKSLFEDRRGRLWIGTLAGLVCLDRGKFAAYHLQADRSYCDIRSLAEDPAGDLWVGTIGRGLFRLPGGQAEKLHRVEEFPTQDARAMHCDGEGTLWVGGWGGGLFRMRDGHFANFTTDDGLPSDRIQSIISDGYGQLWLSTDNGVVGVSPRETLRFERGQSPPLLCLHISLAEGLANGGCSGSGQPVSTRTADGRLWFPNYEGIAVVDPRRVSLRPPAPKVMVEAIVADGKELPPVAPSTWDVPSGVRRFEFDYTAPNLVSPQTMRFRHKLEGMDNDWVDAGTRRVAYYSQLPPGQYQFHVMVGGSDNQWHASDRVLRLRVVPRLWERRWLQTTVGGLLAAILAGTYLWSQRRKYRLRMERLQVQNAMENERRRIARDLHDEFGSSLTGLALQGEAITLTDDLPSTTKTEISSMTRRVRQLIGTLDEVVWATNPANDSLANVVTYLCDHTEDLLSTAPVNCRVDAPAASELPTITLSAQVRHNLLLAAKEAINNSVRHASARTIRLGIRLEPGWLLVDISDDGRGFDPEAKQAGGNGLANIRNRLQFIAGRAEIVSQPGVGTSVRLLMPLVGAADTTE